MHTVGLIWVLDGLAAPVQSTIERTHKWHDSAAVVCAQSGEHLGLIKAIHIFDEGDVRPAGFWQTVALWPGRDTISALSIYPADAIPLEVFQWDMRRISE
jgi:hypothetical protein